MSASLSRLFPVLVALGPLAACGLERPIEQQPLESVVDEWRMTVLERSGPTLVDGQPVQVLEAEIAGDYGELTWVAPQPAEATGSQGPDMITVQLLAGGRDARWGMAVVGLFVPALDDLQPGVPVRIEDSDGLVIGCTGHALGNWEHDDSASINRIEVRVDAEDPSLVHYAFEGHFFDGTELSGRFTVERPSE